MARLSIAVAVVLMACLCGAAQVASGGGVMDSLAGVKSTCDGTVGQCQADDGDELATGSDALLRRSLVRKPTNRYISYAALRADQIPCNKRDRSYYTNCASAGKPANPYQRGCSVITRCARNMN